MIDVRRTSESDPATFAVLVQEGRTETAHVVTLSALDQARYFGEATPEAGIAAAFRFLLDREPKEAILRRFDLSVISTYFPEFGSTIGAYLESGE